MSLHLQLVNEEIDHSVVQEFGPSTHVTLPTSTKLFAMHARLYPQQLSSHQPKKHTPVSFYSLLKG